MEVDVKPFRRVHRSLSKALVRDDSDYSIARAVEPLVSNKALISFFIPVLLITVLQLLQPLFTDNEDLRNVGLVIIGWALGLWYLFGFLLLVGLVARWFFQYRFSVTQSRALAAVTRRLGAALVRSHRNDHEYFEITKWHEEITIRRDGEAVIDRTLTVRAGARPVSILWSACISFGPKLDASEVKILASKKTARGESPLSFDPTWNDIDGHLRSDVHVYPTGDLAPHSELTFRLKWVWPMYASETLFKGAAEEFTYAFNRPCRQFEATVTGPRGTSFGAQFTSSGASQPAVTFGKRSVVVKASDLQANEGLKGYIEFVK